jgi:hypothetical protein
MIEFVIPLSARIRVVQSAAAVAYVRKACDYNGVDRLAACAYLQDLAAAFHLIISGSFSETARVASLFRWGGFHLPI